MEERNEPVTPTVSSGCPLHSCEGLSGYQFEEWREFFIFREKLRQQEQLPSLYL